MKPLQPKRVVISVSLDLVRLLGLTLTPYQTSLSSRACLRHYVRPQTLILGTKLVCRPLVFARVCVEFLPRRLNPKLQTRNPKNSKP